MRRVYKTKTPWPGGWFRHMVPFMRCPFKKSLLVGVIIFGLWKLFNLNKEACKLILGQGCSSNQSLRISARCVFQMGAAA